MEVKGRWKGLCALWMALALTVYAFPVTVIAEDFTEQTERMAEDLSGTESEAAFGPENLAAGADEGETGVSTGNTESPESTERTESIESTESTTSAESAETLDKSSAESRDSEEPSGTEHTSGAEEPSESEGTAEESSEPESAESTEEREESSAEETDKRGENQPEGTTEGTAAETSSVEEPVEKDILESIVKENLALKAAAAERAGETSVTAWLYLGSEEVGVGTIIAPDDTSIKSVITFELNKPFDQQTGLAVTAPSGKELSEWNLWKANSSGYVTGSLNSKAINDTLTEDEYSGFIPTGEDLYLLFVPIWKEEEVKIEEIADGKSLYMQIGTACVLPAGKWKVDGDTTIYNSSGSTVYAAKAETFVFRKQE